MVTELLIALIVFGTLFVSGITLLIVFSVINAKYRRFVNAHCDSIKQIQDINLRYKFFDIENNDMKHSYDNENMYGDISCQDYLIYQLQFIKNKVEKCLDRTYENDSLYRRYNKDIKDKCVFEKYDTEELLRNKKKLVKVEQKEFNKLLKHPVIKYSIHVRLILTNINGDRKGSKSDIFSSDEIEDLIRDLNDKKGKFYNREYIWNAICRVERGKVTNKMRFAVYDRDGWRCRKCGRKTNDLEVDHIYPIAKGGKTTFDNLQTLCHRCNVKKGANIEY